MRTRHLSWLASIPAAGAMILTFAPPVAAAPETYDYLGRFYDLISDDDPPEGTFTRDMRLTGSFTVASPLEPDETYDFSNNGADNDLLLAISFDNGRARISRGNDFVDGFTLTTDSARNISSWSIFLDEFPIGEPQVIIETRSSRAPWDETSISVLVAPTTFRSDTAEVRGAGPGTWTLVPEPSSASLAGLGLLALAAIGRGRGS